MKTTLLALLTLAVSTSALCAESTLPTQFGAAPTLTTVTIPARGPGAFTLASVPENNAVPTSLKLDPGTSNFAQLDGTSRNAAPLSTGFVLALVAGLILALRVMGLNHARAMADHERDSYHGKARMFRSLSEGGADH